MGTGVMGQPMALNLARHVDVVAWNRSPERLRPLADAGATVAREADDVFDACEVVLLMLANGQVVDEVLARGTARFARLVAGRTVVAMGTTAPSYSAGLEVDVVAAGGRYVESPVSGSRQPALDGTLVALMAGDAGPVGLVRPLLEPMCRQTFVCGPVPSGLTMKLAVNLYLITLVTGLAETAEYAERHGLDLAVLRDVLDAGPMASDVSRGKLAKLVAGDLAVQARLADVRYNTDLIAALARGSGTATPLLDVARELFLEAEALGHGGLDMVGVIHALAARSDGQRPTSQR
ncbi:NAD(P)-dependent oxidoreductase [Friedmanniella luteola]|uniref:NAD(P)-dependent oxidoreductase n=1 Tax=Friedmanniella luteola TaxID=546871 RepID=UPI0018D32670|nr:NAD(P)-dependent oxidoreductase [Friedmanniella luteola]